MSSVICVVYSKLLLQEFKTLLNTYTHITDPYIGYNDRLIFLSFCQKLKKLFLEGRCCSETFIKDILRIPDLPVDIVWLLHYFDIVPFFIYIDSGSVTSSDSKLYKFFENMVCQYMDAKNSSLFIETACQNLISVVFNNESPIFCYERHKEILLKIIVAQCKLKGDSELQLVLDGFKSIMTLKGYKIFLLDFMKMFLKSEEKVDLKIMLQLQSEVKKEVEVDIFNSLWQVLNSSEALEFIENLLSQIVILKWDYILDMILSYGYGYTDGFANLKKLVSSYIDKAFTDLNPLPLSLAFLVSRQCCLHHSLCFPNYTAWFSSCFSVDSSRPISTNKICKFFFEFLRDLVQHDKPYYLKVHINKVPCVPQTCQTFVTEYVTLAKTRLCDLNQTYDLGLFDNTDSKHTSEIDVNGVIAHFEKTGEIIGLLLEASIFCKNYYERMFLVELLSTFEGRNSSRHLIIEKLNALGKVPPSMYKKYKQLIC